MILLAFFKSIDVQVAVECLKFLATDNKSVMCKTQECDIKEAAAKPLVEEVGCTAPYSRYPPGNHHASHF